MAEHVFSVSYHENKLAEGKGYPKLYMAPSALSTRGRFVSRFCKGNQPVGGYYVGIVVHSEHTALRFIVMGVWMVNVSLIVLDQPTASYTVALGY
jgi:hypothetical protein